MTQDKAKPETLLAWLDENDASQTWSVLVDNIGYLAGYVVNGRLLIVLEYDGRHEVAGWDVFLGVESRKVDVSLDAMSSACGLTESEDKPDTPAIQPQLYKAGNSISSARDDLRSCFKSATPLEVITLSRLARKALELQDDLAAFHNAIGDTVASKPTVEGKATVTVSSVDSDRCHCMGPAEEGTGRCLICHKQKRTA